MVMDADIRLELEKIRDGISGATRITVLSGAGISAASGIPTFRGEQDSLWSRYRPEDLATPEAFARDPELVWRWYDWRRGLIAAAEPNAAHQALADLEATARVVTITQNVDGYHQMAGSTRVLEFHGSIWVVRCQQCGTEDLDRRVPIPIPPSCDRCGGMIRPGVVWFGEGIDPGVLRASAEAAADCDLFLVVGTAGAVYPAAGLVGTARQAGARVVEFNLEPGGVTHLADLFVPGSAADTLGHLVP
ncbi:MAG: NAD-dependent deacylase [Candidatus Krumholzibacteriota bacterium]